MSIRSWLASKVEMPPLAAITIHMPLTWIIAWSKSKLVNLTQNFSHTLKPTLPIPRTYIVANHCQHRIYYTLGRRAT